jgi:hypothetical protein
MKHSWLLFLLSLPVMYGSGYAYGRMLVGRILIVPYPPGKIGMLVFTTLALFLMLRILFNLGWDLNFFWRTAWMTLTGYGDCTLIALGATAGYRAFNHRQPKTIKGGLHVMEDGGLAIMEPHTANPKKD